MSIIAGIFSRTPHKAIDETACMSIRQHISRNPDLNVTCFQHGRIFMSKVDVNAYRLPAYRSDDSGSVTMLAGDPLLAEAGSTAPVAKSRDSALDAIHDCVIRGNDDVLKSARGVFSFATYNPVTAVLTLGTDKLGVRALYYWADEEYVVFAGALRILEALEIVPKKLDLQGVAEIATLGYPLGARTPFADIYRLKAGELVQFFGTTSSRKLYWQWDNIPLSRQSESELLREAYETFDSAVSLRLQEDTAAIAFLSGGMDSRSVVSALKNLGTTLYTFNFSMPDTMDQVFAREVARQLDSSHSEHSTDVEHQLYRDMSATLKQFNEGMFDVVERPQLIWSGEGGSVGLGHVYLNAELVAHMQSGKVSDAIHTFLHQGKIALPAKLFSARTWQILSEHPLKGITEELQNINSYDSGRDFYLFLLLNDQRCHLTEFFEEMDLHRLEFHTPFYDSDFLQVVIKCPIDLCLNHRFYTKWLGLFPSFATSVPWQTYPGHESCPLPIPEGLRSQWQTGGLEELEKMKRQSLLNISSVLLGKNHFPHELISKNRFRVASMVYKLGWRDYSYVIRTANIFYKYWNICKPKHIVNH